MFAMGHQRTFHDVRITSALPPIAGMRRWGSARQLCAMGRHSFGEGALSRGIRKVVGERSEYLKDFL
jgi:hypothetical protein